MPAFERSYATQDEDFRAKFSQSEKLRRLNRLRSLARVMDTAFRLPGTQIRFGLDSIMGIVPGAGDAGGAAIGLFIVNEARKLGVPKRKLVRMLANLGTDFAVGSVPLVGDLFDVYFKAHRRNLQLVLDHFELDRQDLDVAEARLKDVTPRR